MSNRLSIELGWVIEFHTLEGPKKFFFFNMKYLTDNFQKNIYCNFECEHDIQKMVGVQEVILIEKFIWKFL